MPLRSVPAPAGEPALEQRRQAVAQRKIQRKKRSLELLQGSLSARKVERQAPWLAGLHRVVDGGLMATGVAAISLAGLTLHWQGRWGHDYRDLQAAQELEHRVQESLSALEQYHLQQARRPGALVATRSEDLLFVPSPPPATEAARLPQRPLQLGTIAGGY